MTISRRMRHRIAIVPVVLGHAAAIALVMANHAGAGTAPIAGKASIAVFDVSPPKAAEGRPAPHMSPLPSPIVDVPLLRPVSLELAPPVVEPLPVLSDAPLAAGEVCDVAGHVQATLRGDAKVGAALAMLPKGARSVANAVMLWDGHWIDGQTVATRYALGQIRAAVLTEVAAMPAPCRGEVQAGPALMIVAGTPDTVLALGSGRWRWADMFGVSENAEVTTTASLERRGAASAAPAT